MLTCAIPECQAQERFLRSGTLHLVDVPRDARRDAKKMIWLCPVCSVNYTVQGWREPGQQIRPRQHTILPTLDEIISARISMLIPRPRDPWAA